MTDQEAAALSTWCPSHGGLIVDDVNQTSVNFHPLPGGRFSLSRTCQGPPEYSGRGGRQLYTHALIFEKSQLKEADYQPFALYWDALALGHLHYQPDPPLLLEKAELSTCFLPREEQSLSNRLGDLDRSELDRIVAQLLSGKSVKWKHSGDRIQLAECLVALLSPEQLLAISFSTSLRPSSVRPFLLNLVD